VSIITLILQQIVPFFIILLVKYSSPCTFFSLQKPFWSFTHEKCWT